MTNKIEYDAYIYCGMKPSERWKYHIPKQLVYLPNDKKMLIQRTIDQLHARDYYPDLVTSLAAFNGLKIPTYIPNKSRWLVESVHSTLAHIPKDHGLIVFLGDVYYSNAFMDMIIHAPDDLRFFGETFEIYAVKIPPGMPKLLYTQYAQEAINLAEHERCRGKLWDSYYLLMGGLAFLKQAYQTTGVLPREDNRLFKLKESFDPSCDFDLYEQYAEFCERDISPFI